MKIKIVSQISTTRSQISDNFTNEQYRQQKPSSFYIFKKHKYIFSPPSQARHIQTVCIYTHTLFYIYTQKYMFAFSYNQIFKQTQHKNIKGRIYRTPLRTLNIYYIHWIRGAHFLLRHFVDIPCRISNEKKKTKLKRYIILYLCNRRILLKCCFAIKEH